VTHTPRRVAGRARHSGSAEGPTQPGPLDADLELGSLGGGHTQLAISARYRPPLGALGRAVDRVLPLDDTTDVVVCAEASSAGVFDRLRRGKHGVAPFQG
jgi:hypothetical protein